MCGPLTLVYALSRHRSGFSCKNHLCEYEQSENLARLAAGQVYLKVNFLLPWEVVCSGMSGHVAGGEGMQRFSFRDVFLEDCLASPGLIYLASPGGNKVKCFSRKWKLA